jgi:hypothetical protein
MEDHLHDEILFDKIDDSVSCEPEDNLDMKILAFLSPKGTNKECDISNLFNKSFLNYPSLQYLMLQDRHKLIANYLNKLSDIKYIEYKNLTHELNYPTIKWMNDVYFKAFITLPGNEFYKNDLIRKASLNNYKWNRWIAISALIVSIFALVYTVCNRSVSEIRIERLEEQQKILLKQKKMQLENSTIKNKIHTKN